MNTPFDQVGGRDVVLSLVARFYERMARDEPALAALHELDANGQVSAKTQERFGLFLIGWLGGPQDYVAQYGHPRLRMRHARVPIDTAQRDAWVRCMVGAMQDRALPGDVQSFLTQRFSEVADFLRNTDG